MRPKSLCVGSSKAQTRGGKRKQLILLSIMWESESCQWKKNALSLPRIQLFSPHRPEERGCCQGDKYPAGSWSRMCLVPARPTTGAQGIALPGLRWYRCYLWQCHSSAGATKSSPEASRSLLASHLFSFYLLIPATSPSKLPCVTASATECAYSGADTNERTCPCFAEGNHISADNPPSLFTRGIKPPHTFSLHERAGSVLAVLQQVKWLPGLQAALPPSPLACSKPASADNAALTIHSSVHAVLFIFQQRSEGLSSKLMQRVVKRIIEGAT